MTTAGSDLSVTPPAEARWACVAARAAAERTDAPTVVLDVSELLVVTGFFVITSARNHRLVRTIVEHVEQRVAEEGGPRPLRIEGLDTLSWVLMDHGDFVVHVFDEEARSTYDLERLWRYAPRIDWHPVDDPDV